MGEIAQGRTNGKLGESPETWRDPQDRPARLVARNKNYMPVVVDAKYISDYKIFVVFDNGEQRLADFSKWGLGRGMYKPLKDKEYFKTFFVDGWTISWPNGADIAPETLYEQSEPV
jgi:hypothetical protein